MQELGASVAIARFVPIQEAHCCLHRSRKSTEKEVRILQIQKPGCFCVFFNLVTEFDNSQNDSKSASFQHDQSHSTLLNIGIVRSPSHALMNTKKWGIP